MKAFVLTTSGPRLTEHPTPSPRPGEVLIAVHAAALNRVDLAMLGGHVHGNAGGVGAALGVELAGEVIEVGSQVTNVRVGQRVMCAGAGAFAERAVVDAGRVLPVPEALDFTRAAALPVALQTMHDAVVTNGHLAAEQTVLVQGASSGVGLMAMQIAKLLGARWVAGSSTNDARRARLSEYGADLAFDSRDPGWVPRVLDATQGQGVDLVIDQIGAPLAKQNMLATKVHGRIVNVGRLGGMRGEFDFDLHAFRRISYVGVTFRTRTREELRAVTEVTRAALYEPLVAGALTLPIDRVFQFDDIEAALAHMRADQHFGKIVVRIH
jgi:NADPH:quinone reductase